MKLINKIKVFIDIGLRACLIIWKDAVFVPKPVWLGATRENSPRGSATGEQQRQTGLGAKTLRVTALLPWSFVVAFVTARYGDAPTAPPRPRPKSPAAAPFPIFRQALKHLNESFDSMAYQGIMGFTPYMRRSMEKPDKEN